METLLKKAYEPIEGALALFEKRLKAEVDGRFPYPSFLFSGKRLRPACVFFTAKAFDGVPEDVLRCALAVEMLHAGTLIHDDIVDSSLERRGAETLHERYGLVDAVLAGDSLFLKSLRQIDAMSRPGLMEEFLDTCEVALLGEQAEEDLSPRQALNRENYLKVISMKTAHLFALSFSLGASTRNCPPEHRKALRDAGHNFGMAYQIIDDCEDLFAGRDGDLEAGKFTLPVIEAAEASPALKDLLLSGRFRIEDVRSRVADADGIKIAVQRARHYLSEAWELISSAGDPEMETGFAGFFNYMEARAGRL